MNTCADCRVRRREFPEAVAVENGEKLTGRICKVCDRKFLMLDHYNKKVKPLSKREADLRIAVQSYEMILKTAHFAISEEQKFQ